LRRSTYQPSITLRVHTFLVMCLLRSSIISSRHLFSSCVHRNSRTEYACMMRTIRSSCCCVTAPQSSSIEKKLFASDRDARNGFRSRRHRFSTRAPYECDGLRLPRDERERGQYLPRIGQRNVVVGGSATLHTRPGPFALRKDILPGHPQSFARPRTRCFHLDQA
jgi:hypothetical protein